MADNFNIDELCEWVSAEYARRTDAIEAGHGSIDWLIPEYRVSWSEVVARAEEMGWRGNPVDLRLAYHQKELEKCAK